MRARPRRIETVSAIDATASCREAAERSDSHINTGRVGTRISMDGKGRCLDNIFIERLWRSLKHECVYPHAWETGSQAKAGVGHWITFYNHQRPHAAHGGQPPAVVYSKATQTDQQVQAVAQITPGTVQELGSSSTPRCQNRHKRASSISSCRRHQEVALALDYLHLCDINVEKADGVALEILAFGLVAFDIWKARDAGALQAPVQRRPSHVRDLGPQSIETIVYRQQRMTREHDNHSLLGSVRTVGCSSVGPVFILSTVARSLHFATVFGMMPSSRPNCVSEACDRCIAALTACLAVALQ